MPLALWRDWRACPEVDALVRGVSYQVAYGRLKGEVWLSRQVGENGEYVLRTQSPIWSEEGSCSEREEFLDTCHQAMGLAKQLGCHSLAIPLVDLCAYGLPIGHIQRLVSDAAIDFLCHQTPDNDMAINVITGGKLPLTLPPGLRSYVRQNVEPGPRRGARGAVMEAEQLRPRARAIKAETLADALETLDETFSQMVVRKLAEKGMQSTQCYHRANIDRRLFSKIVNNVNYRPGKTTALALAVALELPLEETRELLMKAGLALSHSHKLDVIVEFFILRGQYDLFEINEALYAFDQPLLGDVGR